MYYSEYNLRQLLEIALRVPEVGAVNFNILYTILKAIIQKQGLEGVKPYFSIDVPLPAHTASLKSKLSATHIKRSYSDESLQPADSYRSDDTSIVGKEDSDPDEMLKIHQKEEAVRWQILKLVKRIETFEDEITELHVLISQMMDKLLDMERITTLQDSSFTTQINELREKLKAEESTKKNVEDIIPEIEDQFVSSLSPVVQEFHKKLEENYSEGHVLKEKVEQVSLDLDTIQEYMKNLDDKLGVEVELKIKENVQELVSKEIDLGLKSIISDVEALRVKHAQLDETFKKCVSDSAFMKDSFDSLTLKHEELIEQIQDIEKGDTQGPETDNLLRRLEELEEYVYSGSKYQTEMEGLAGMLSRFEFKSESEEILPLIFDRDESEEEIGTIPEKVKADASKKHAAAELSEISEMKPAVKTAMEMFFKRKKMPEDDERESKGMKKMVKVKGKKDADKQALNDKEKKDSDKQALKVKKKKYDDKQAEKIKEKKETDKQAGEIKEKKEIDKQAEKIKGKKEADKEAMKIKGKKDTDKQALEFKEKKIADKQKEAVELKQDEEIDEYDEIKVDDFKEEDEITEVKEKSKEISKRKFQRALKKIGTVKRMHRPGEKEEEKEQLEDDQKEEELEGIEKEEFEDVEEEEHEAMGEIKDYESSEEECETVEVKEDEYISPSQEDLDDDEQSKGLEKAKVKFRTAVHGVNLIGSLDKKKRKGKKARFKEVEIEEDEEQETEQYEEKSTQELFDEITNLKTREERSSSDESSEENFLYLPSPTVLSKDIFEEYILKMKHQIILYIKKHLQHSQDNVNYKESEIPILKKKVDGLEKQMHIVNKRLNIKDSNSQIIEDDMNALKRITKNHLLDIMDIKHQLARKAEAYAVNKKASFNELTAVEDRIMKLCLATSTDLVALESKLENSNKILSEKLDKKINYEEFNIQLETVVRKLQELEKMFKAYSTPKIIQDFGDIRPIQVRHYIQGKGSSRFLSACKRITSPDKVISELSDCYFQEVVPNEIQKQVQNKMEKATFRESTHYISGAHTKLQRKRN